jgi:hypothetical protein
MRLASIGHYFEMASRTIREVAWQFELPSVQYRPSVSIDGNQWCALYGENLQDGVAGFGDSPEEAMSAFNKAWRQKLETAHKCPRCDAPNPDHDDTDGCRDPECPEQDANAA